MLNAPVTGNENLDAFLFDIQNEISAITGLVFNSDTGEVTDPETGEVVSYLYKYIHIQYADDSIGTGMTTTDLSKSYFGVYNSESATASTNPAAYTWYLTVGLTATERLYALVPGGRQIRFYVGASPQPSGYVLVGNVVAPIDLDATTSSQPGVSTTVAYKVQSQVLAAPTFTTPTVGNAIPADWSVTAPIPAVGQVLWYIFGKYNSSETDTIDGVGPNSTDWTGPTAASFFQDIRSDNWDGSNPPTFATPTTWGTTGYYIKRNDGTMILNNVGARGTLQAGTAIRTATSMTGNGAVFHNDGKYAAGNSGNNLSFDGTTLYVNGAIVNASAGAGTAGVLKAGDITRSGTTVGSGKGAEFRADGTFAIGKPGASIVGDGTDVYIDGFIDDLATGITPFTGSSGTISSYTPTHPLGPYTIKNGKYTVNVAGSINMSIQPTVFRRIYVYVAIRVNIDGNDTESPSSGCMIPVANGGPYTHIHPVSLFRQFDLSANTGSEVIFTVEPGVICYGVTDNTQYAEILSINCDNLYIDAREYNT